MKPGDIVFFRSDPEMIGWKVTKIYRLDMVKVELPDGTWRYACENELGSIDEVGINIVTLGLEKGTMKPTSWDPEQMKPGDIVYFRASYTRIPWQVVDIAGYLALIDLPDGTARFTEWHRLEVMSEAELLEMAGFVNGRDQQTTT